MSCTLLLDQLFLMTTCCRKDISLGIITGYPVVNVYNNALLRDVLRGGAETVVARRDGGPWKNMAY